ncbi:MAG: hypothetical protein K0B87_02795 [Candidatus Syntrophosphaera sp.]|nr:hypothetical protein [Candidatus Syntrophosphaera sp.]
MKAFLCLCFGLLAASLAAVITEDSASANALSGITLLSQSVSDLALSPTINKAGIAFSTHIPFREADCGVYSLNTATRLKPLLISAGGAFLDQGDYRWQDVHLGLAFHYQDLSLGYSEHLIYERFSTQHSYHTWTGNLALSYRGEMYGSEIRLLHLGEEDAELHISASTRVVDQVQAASSYVYALHGADSFRFATSFAIGESFLLQASWQNTPPRFGAGLKFTYRSGELMYAVRSHAELSLSHSLDLGFNW